MRAAAWLREQRLKERAREKAVAAKMRAAMAADLAAFDGFVRVLRRYYKRLLEREHGAKRR